MEVSVILGLNRDVECLERVVWGYFRQSHHEFEILIADDRPDGDMEPCIERWKRHTGLSIRRVHAEGPEASRLAILNRAIQSAAGSYLVFSEGCSIPRWDFLEVHVRLASPGYFLSGGSVLVSPGLSRAITVEDVVSGRATDPKWLFQSGMADGSLRVPPSGPQWARLLDVLTGAGAAFNCGNTSCRKADLLEVNGFDERVQCAAVADRELGRRLGNRGIRGRQVRHRAICFELHRPKSYLRRESAEQALDLLAQTRRSRATWTAYGIRRELRVFGIDEKREAAAPCPPRRAVA